MTSRLLSKLPRVHKLCAGTCTRHIAYYGPEPIPGELPSLAEKLAAQNPPDETSFRVDIGLPPSTRAAERSNALEKSKILAKVRNDLALEKLARERKLEVPYEGVEEEWKLHQASKDIKIIADHYGVFSHLFGDAYFFPRVMLDIEYELNDESVMPVHRGNVIKPREALNAPHVSYKADSSSLWTLTLTNLDGNLSTPNSEYVHWLIGNIPGSDLSKGDLVYNYMPPFPPAGTGLHRLVFLLYKQEKKLDFAELKQTLPCYDLSLRTFNTLEFYRARQDDLTPAGLAFYQSDYDRSVQDTFHKVLKMDEPRFEYDFPEYYVSPQKWFPKKEPFDEYMDKYRDPKEINKEYIVARLKNYNPFESSPRKLKYPGVHVPSNIPTWLKRKMLRNALGWGSVNEAE